MNLLSVILPTFNEAGSIVALLESLCDELAVITGRFELIIVDDSSPDGTADRVRDAFSTDERVRVIVREQERGLATAVRDGIRHAMGDRLVVMDTDFNHDPMSVPSLVNALDRADLAVGSRFLPGGGMAERWRWWASFAYNRAIGRLLETGLTDHLSGFFAARRTRLDQLPLDAICTGYGDYFIRLLVHAHRRRLRIVEIPVYYPLRRAGASKSRFADMLVQYTRTVRSLQR